MDEEIKRTVEILKNGGVIVYPTDTIWGIGCDATNSAAVAKIFSIKKRIDSKSMLVLADSLNMIERYIPCIPSVAYELIEVATSPLTIIYPQAIGIASNLLAEDNSLGIRITGDEFCRKLIAAFKKPIVSTSANISGMPYPSSFKDIDPQITAAVDYVVRWKQDNFKPGKPSGIIKLGVNGEIKVIRE
jgi:L-threonylcarbamoyladenylate synthase